MKLGMEVGLGPGHIVLDGDPAPPNGHNPQLSAHVYCGQTVAHLSYCWALVASSYNLRRRISRLDMTRRARSEYKLPVQSSRVADKKQEVKEVMTPADSLLQLNATPLNSKV